MSGPVTSPVVIRAFFTPTQSTIMTLVSKRTETRFTYRIARKEPRPDGQSENVWFVDVLTGPNNTEDYSPLAVVTKRGASYAMFHARASRIDREAPSAVAFAWAFGQIVERNMDVTAKLDVYHAGKCARCGRLLSRPDSIELGVGPECAKELGL